MKFRKKPVVVDAILWTCGIGKQLEAVAMLNEFCGRNWSRADAVDERGPQDDENVVVWNTLEAQWLNVPVGHWIIRGVHGELYPCAPAVFQETYQAEP